MTEKEAIKMFIADLRQAQGEAGGTLLEVYNNLIRLSPEAKGWADLAPVFESTQSWASDRLRAGLGKHINYTQQALTSPKLLPILRKLDARDAAKAGGQ